jgi:hypothetical protein
MKIFGSQSRAKRKGISGFTLSETVMSIGILGLVIEGVLLGYVKISQQAEWSARSLAAQSMASQGAELVRAAQWNLQMWPQGVGPGLSDQLGLTNFVQTGTLDILAGGQPLTVTNYVSVTQVSANPPVRQIRSDCVWNFMGRGPFTNTVVTLRTSDQRNCILLFPRSGNFRPQAPTVHSLWWRS